MQRSYDIESSFFGIRTNSEACGDWLGRTLKAYEVTDDEADPYISVFLAEEGRLGRRFHTLYREGTALVKTFDIGALGRALFSELETFTLRDRDDAIHLEAGVASSNGVRALVPSGIVPFIGQLGRRASQHLSFPVESTVAVDVASGRVVPSAPTLRVPADAFDRLARLDAGNGNGRSTAPAPGEIDVVCIYSYDRDQPDEIVQIKRGFALYLLADLVKNLAPLSGRALQGLAKLVDGKPCYLLQQGSAQQALDTLTRVIESPEAAAPA